MSILYVLVVLILFAILWRVLTSQNVTEDIKRIVLIVFFVVLILWLLGGLHIFSGGTFIHFN